MIDGWPERIREAQKLTVVWVGGALRWRIRYGSELHDWATDRFPCHDCAVVKGQLHVPGCDVEQCPACGDQAMCCGCERRGSGLEVCDRGVCDGQARSRQARSRGRGLGGGLP